MFHFGCSAYSHHSGPKTHFCCHDIIHALSLDLDGAFPTFTGAFSRIFKHSLHPFPCHRSFRSIHCNSSGQYPSALYKIWLTLRTHEVILARLDLVFDVLAFWVNTWKCSKCLCNQHLYAICLSIALAHHGLFWRGAGSVRMAKEAESEVMLPFWLVSKKAPQWVNDVNLCFMPLQARY